MSMSDIKTLWYNFWNVFYELGIWWSELLLICRSFSRHSIGPQGPGENEIQHFKNGSAGLKNSNLPLIPPEIKMSPKHCALLWKQIYEYVNMNRPLIPELHTRHLLRAFHHRWHRTVTRTWGEENCREKETVRTLYFFNKQYFYFFISSIYTKNVIHFLYREIYFLLLNI